MPNGNGRIEHQVLIDIRSSNALAAEPEQIIRQHKPLVDAPLADDRAAATSAIATHIQDERAILVEHPRKAS